ncbi:hypothetical protein ACO0K9_27655 [Undibacterium sp. Ji50W]|uniref:hypothetical protein n=1 Tax=Undibacterium sp. Ji50W TaxID=3413041 RepID=UPI003BF18108
MKNLIFTITCLLLIAGCSKNEPAKPPAPSMERPIPVHIATMDEWTSALSSAYIESQTKDKGDGVTEFMAAFGTKENKNFSIAFGERDGFRKLRIYKAGMPMNIGTSVKTYVSVPDGKKPILFIAPYYWGRSWLFMKKLSIMVDGNVIFEHDFELNTSNRRTEGVGVAESYDLVATEQDIDALRKIHPESKVLVRISGDKGYVNLIGKNKRHEIDAIEDFQRDIVSAIVIYDEISKAIKGHIPPNGTSNPPKSLN